MLRMGARISIEMPGWIRRFGNSQALGILMGFFGTWDVVMLLGKGDNNRFFLLFLRKKVHEGGIVQKTVMQ